MIDLGCAVKRCDNGCHVVPRRPLMLSNVNGDNQKLSCRYNNSETSPTRTVAAFAAPTTFNGGKY